ncbi:transient receptor potential cation channel protein painless-like [Drosophila tropicalis]|uniref:transient receptor potential cation channel protein painless-like n=1 Tax=Drosophila tropicalis TaxID=46794 RepID=UPI0035ABDD40
MSDLEQALKDALNQNNIERFETALQNGAKAYEYIENGISIYEMCLQRPNSREFIEACLRNGCTADYVNEGLQKAAINYAADSACSANILSLLNCNTNLQLDHQYAELTPLNALAKCLTNDNVNDLEKAIFELLNRGASPNIPDKNDITPLHYIVIKSDLHRTQKKRLINRFLKEKTLDLDRFRNGQLRELLRKQYPDLILPEPRSECITMEITYDNLLNMLRYGNENDFLDMSANYNGGENDILKLLKECITSGRHRSFDELLRAHNNLNINHGFAGEKKLTLIELSLIHGNWYTLEKLLNHQELKWPSDKLMLINLMGRLDEPPVNAYSDYWKCFRLLVQSKHVDINERDESGHTPLHYAARYRHESAVHSLLAKGARLGATNEFKEMPLTDFDDTLWLEKYFNQCITTRSKSRADKSFEIIMDFRNLDLPAIDYMAGSKHLRSLLKHPLITSFILFKWSLFCGFFYFHLMMHAIFTLSIFIHAYLKFSELQNPKSIWPLCLIYICLAYLTLCEITAFCIRLSLNRWFSFNSLLNIAMIVLSCISIHIPSAESQRTCTAYVILMAILSFSHLLGALPLQNSISTHILMLRETSKNYIKILLFYSIYFIAFGFCFYILFGTATEQETEINTTNEKKKSYHTFSNPINSIIKTLVMATGEFEASDIRFQGLCSYLFFLLFVIFTTLIILNLLTGISVGDSQTIRADAEINSLICRARVLYIYQIFEQNPDTKIIIYPNDKNRVIVPKENENDNVQDVEGDNSTEMTSLNQSRTGFRQNGKQNTKWQCDLKPLQQLHGKWFKCKIDKKTSQRALDIQPGR